MVQPINALILADIHGNRKAIKSIITDIKKERKKQKIDLIIIAGDLPQTTPVSLMVTYIITHRDFSRTNYSKWVYQSKGRRKFIRYQQDSIKDIVIMLEEITDKIIYVPGNVDTTESINYLKNFHKTIVLDQHSYQTNNYLFIGIGGSLVHVSKDKNPICDYEFNSADYSLRCKKAIPPSLNTNLPKILITHELPSFSLKSSNKKINGGSSSLSKTSKEISPLIHIFGHYHELRVLTKYNDTLLLNPGPATCYYYALAHFSTDDIKIELKRSKPKIFDSSSLIYSRRLPINNIEQLITFN